MNSDRRRLLDLAAGRLANAMTTLAEGLADPGRDDVQLLAAVREAREACADTSEMLLRVQVMPDKPLEGQ